MPKQVSLDVAPIGAHIKATRLAALWDVSARYIKNLVKNGTLRGYRLERDIVVDVASANEFLSKHRMSLEGT